LASTSELVATLVEHLEDGVWVLDATDGRVEDANAAAARLLTLDRVPTGRSFGELLVPALPPEGWRLLVDQIPDEGTHRLTVSLRRADETIVPTDLVLTRASVPVAAPPGTPPRVRPVVLAVTRDLSERVRLTEHLRTQRELLDRTIDALGEGVAVVDRHGRIETTNATFAELVDVPAEQLVDRSVFDPPWHTLDHEGSAVAPESTPAVTTLRTGRSVRGRLVQVPGNGRLRATGEAVWLRATSEPIRDATGGTDGAVVTFTDVSEVRDLEQRLADTARIDALTGMSTRAHVVETLERELAAGAEADGRRVGVLHVDLDNFRSVNDTFGTVVGDQVLAAIGDRLADLTDRHVEIGRVGVDEFLVVVTGDGPSMAFDARLGRLAEEIQRRAEQLLTIDGLDLRMTASVGVSRWPGDGDDAAALQRAADRALTAGRRDGRHQLRFYERSLDERTRTGLALDRDLRRAAAQRGLEVHYQPIIDLRTGRVAAAEALVRWHHPEHGPIPPSVFIPTAEATGAISAISDLVMTTVAENLAEWNRDGLLPEGARIAVNISATEFGRRGFVERIAATLKDADVSPSQVELEITETLLMNDLETTATRLTELDELGFLVALDDFGTGYSSLSYLHSLPLHTLKVDRCFVGDLRDGRSETITRAILSLAHGLGISSVGEGVETDEQRTFLIDAGCDLVQGYFYSPPLPRPAFETFLREHSAAAAAAEQAGPATSDQEPVGT
jgi:diguanylate cyclase (GGDEF)-like protein/PAS domain S-box-containing protein